MRGNPVPTRRAFIGALAGGLLGPPFAVEAQEAAKVERIGVLFTTTRPSEEAIGSGKSLRLGLRELGWIEGQNLVIEERWADGKADRFAELAGELAGLKVRAIVTTGTTAIRVARDAAPNTPIVMGGGAIPSGQVSSRALPDPAAI